MTFFATLKVALAALRTHRDRAMVQAMLLGGLRRCEVLGLRLADVRPGEKRLFVAEGKGGSTDGAEAEKATEEK